jgi:hypothetical protein
MDMDYCLIVTYTREDKKEALIEVAEKASTEKVCIISFLPLEGNAPRLKLIDDELNRACLVHAATRVPGQAPGRQLAYRHPGEMKRGASLQVACGGTSCSSPDEFHTRPLRQQ